MNGAPVSGVGNLTRDPELRTTQGGISWVTFSVAVNRYRGTGENRKEETTFLNCKAWRETAENIAASLHKGDRVFVTGTLVTEKWNDRDGNPRESMVVDVDEVGPSLRWATASVTRTERRGGGGGGGSYGSGGGYGGQSAPAPAAQVPAEDAGYDPFGMGGDDGESPF